MFLKFHSDAQRRAFGGSDFLEIQYCSLPAGSSARKTVSVDSIHNWNLSSLYVSAEDMDDFYAQYKDILHNGLYNNLREGVVDLFGINYYDAEKTCAIIENLRTCKPKGYETLLAWLRENPYNNGFYVLGI